MTTLPVRETSQVDLCDLRIRADRDEFVVGRVDTGDFIAVPPIAAEVLDLVKDGLPVGELRQCLQKRHGRDIDVAGFLNGLVELGFVAAVDGEPVPGPPVPAPTLPRLGPRHTRWIVNRYVAAAMAAIVVAGLAAVVAVPGVRPAYHDLLWSPHASLALIGNAVIGWSILVLHEFGHLVTARAQGVPGRIRLGTRLQFLVAQTDVSGIWAAPRPARLVVYLSGIALNLTVAAGALLVKAAVPDSLARQVAAAVVILALVTLPFQFLVFMRTDLYYVLQDLTGCRNLYGDGTAHLRWWARARRGSDPSAALPRPERRAVRVYAVLVAVGTLACLAVAVTVTVPFGVAVVSTTLKHPSSVDAITTVALVALVWALWAHAWWRLHGPRVRRWARAIRPHTTRPATAERR